MKPPSKLQRAFGQTKDYENRNTSLGYQIYEEDTRDFPQLLDAWMKNEGCDDVQLFLKKTYLDRFITPEEFTPVYLGQATPDTNFTTLLALHLPGQVLRPDEHRKIGQKAFKSLATDWCNKNPRLPVLALSDESFSAFKCQVLDDILASSGTSGLSGSAELERNRDSALREEILDYMVEAGKRRNPEADAGTLHRLVTQKLRTQYQDDPDATEVGMQEFVGRAGIKASEEDVKKFLSELAQEHSQKYVVPAAARALSFVIITFTYVCLSGMSSFHARAS